MEKRILILTNHFDPEYFKINDLVKWIKQDGNNSVTVVTGNPNYPKGKIYPNFSVFGSKTVRENLIVYRLPLIPRGKGTKFMLGLNYISYFFTSLLFTAFFLIFKKKFQKVFVHHTSPPFILIPALIYKKIRKAKLFLWDLDMWPQTLAAANVLRSKLFLKILEKIFRSFYKGFDLILLGSKHYEKIALKRVDQSRIKYFPNWADPIFEKTELIQNSLNKEKKIIISYTGNIGKSQDLESLVKAVSLIQNKNFEIRLIGDGRNKDSLLKLVANMKLNNSIRFFDSVSPKELMKYYKESHFLYFSLKNTPLFEKTVPAKFQTYMAVAIPVIGFVSGESYDLIKKNELGFACKSEKPEKLSNIFEELTNLKDEDYQKMKLNCRSLYDNEFHSRKRKHDLEYLLK